MAGLIPQRFIDDLLDRVDIVDVIGARLELRKTGKNHSARCPFHDEKTPSFSVNPEKQFYYCFGCGAGGNAIGFVMDYDHVDFPQAVETLGVLVGMEVPREAQQNNPHDKRRKALYEILDQAKRFYQQQLRQHNSAHQAVDYLKQRGLSGAIAGNFDIGYAPPGWDNLLLAIGESRLQQNDDELRSNDTVEDETIALLTDSGLLVNREEENKRYDRFRERIIFPIRDTRGRTIAFGGRVLGDDKPKYLNSPETTVFHKGRELYGLYEANRSRQSNDNLLVVEGYMDVVALAQHEIENAVATLGTAVSEAHLEKLFRYTSEVVFCFDGDKAGRQAGERALEASLPLMTDGRSAKFLFLDEGEDPDTLVRKIGNERFRHLISSATPLSAFLFTLCEEGLDLTLADDCARFATLAAPMIHQLPAGIFRQLLLEQLAKKTGLATDTLTNLIAPPSSKTPPQWDEAAADNGNYDDYGAHYADAEPPPTEDNYPAPEDYDQREGEGQKTSTTIARPASASTDIQLKPLHCLIALLINHPSLAQNIERTEALLKLELGDIDILHGLFTLLEKNPDYTLNHILGYWRGVHGQEQGEVLAGIAATDLANIPGQAVGTYTKQAQDIVDALLRSELHEKTVEQRIEYLSTKSQLNDHDRKTAFSIWLELSSDERSPELINMLKRLLERRDETSE
ncbi:MAG: DNA primase [Porticoccaceae bacterium]|nr:DNA primase [Porticoccaceae bacterium]